MNFIEDDETNGEEAPHPQNIEPCNVANEVSPLHDLSLRGDEPPGISQTGFIFNETTSQDFTTSVSTQPDDHIIVSLTQLSAAVNKYLGPCQKCGNYGQRLVVRNRVCLATRLAVDCCECNKKKEKP